MPLTIHACLRVSRAAHAGIEAVKANTIDINMAGFKVLVAILLLLLQLNAFHPLPVQSWATMLAS